MKQLGFVLLLCFSPFLWADSAMTQNKMEDIVREMASESSGQGGRVVFVFNGMTMTLLSDVKHDRMRIITPIAKYASLKDQQREAVMVSNFHLALDARYAVSQGTLFSAYIHPLSSLTQQQLEAAVYQVHNLAFTFGDQYSSGALSFGAKRPPAKSDSLDDEAAI